MAAMDSNTSKSMDDDQEINLADLFNVLIQGWKLIAAIFVVVFGLGLAYAILTPPVYEADALIQVEDQGGASGLAGLSMLTEGLGIQQSIVADELEILRSREVLLKALEATGATTTIKVANRFPLIGDWLARRHGGDSAELAEPLFNFGNYAWGGEVLELGELSLPRRALGEDFFLEITEAGFELRDAAGEVLVADSRLGQRLPFTVNGQDAYIAIKHLKGNPGTRFLIKEASPITTYERLRAGLSISQAGKQQSQVISLKYQSTDRQFATDFVNAIASTYLEQNVQRRSAEARQSLVFLDEQLPLLKDNVEQKEEELSQFRSSSGTISIPDETRGLLDQAIDLENRRLELQMKRDEMRQRYTTDHPMFKALNQQLAGIQAASKDLSGHIDTLPEAQRDLLRLERDTQVNTQLYISLLNNAQQLRLAEAGTIGNVRVIDFAVLAERPVKPKRSLIVLVAAMLGLMLGMFAALVRRFLRPAVQTAEQLEHRTGLTTYASLPESDLQTGFRIAMPGRRSRKKTSQVLAFTNPEDPAIESLRSLRTGMTFAMMGTQGKAIAIVGATSGVGKSFVTANLSALLATADKKVVVVDTDLRRGRLHEYFGYTRKNLGLSDVLLGKVSLNDALVKVNDNLFVLPAGTPPPNPGELLLNAHFGELIQKLEAEVDHVIIDTAPLLPVADTLAIMPYVAAAFMVVRAEQSTVREIQDAAARLRTAGLEAPLKGVIFNGVRRFRLGYGTSYNYYYTYK